MSATLRPSFIARCALLSKGTRPRNGTPCSEHQRSISVLSSGLTSERFTHTAVRTRAIDAVRTSRCMSPKPDTEGSVTMSARLTPFIEAITGQPTPGEPSIIAS